MSVQNSFLFDLLAILAITQVLHSAITFFENLIYWRVWGRFSTVSKASLHNTAKEMGLKRKGFKFFFSESDRSLMKRIEKKRSEIYQRGHFVKRK